jgi:hypothetical protein
MTMDREYSEATVFQAPVREYATQIAPRERADLSSVRARLTECVKRAEDLGIGVHNLADSLVGSRPEDAPAGAPRPLEPSFTQLVDDLAAAIGRIESGLNRL